MNNEIALILLLEFISVIIISLCIIVGAYPDKKTQEPEVKTKIRITKTKVLNKLIVKDKKERILNEGSGSGFIYNGFGNGSVNMTSRTQRILVVYDTYTNKYDEVPVTIDTYYKSEIGDEIMFDAEEFSHYDYKYDYVTVNY